jgi:uncharacterized membrane protein YesL
MLQEERSSARAMLVEAYLLSIPLITTNVMWLLLSLPVVTLIPATGGLYYATNLLAHDKVSSWRSVLEGFRRHFWLSWRWGSLNLVIYGGLIANIWFYGQVSWGVWFRPLFLLLTLLWTLLQIYLFPILLEQERPSLRLALRNSFILLLRRPFHTLGWFIALAVLALGSTYFLPPLWLVFTVSLLLYLSNRATIQAIERLNGSRKEF